MWWHYFIKLQIFWVGHKVFRKFPSFLWCYLVILKDGGRFIQILWPSHNNWTLIPVWPMTGWIWFDWTKLRHIFKQQNMSWMDELENNTNIKWRLVYKNVLDFVLTIRFQKPLKFCFKDLIFFFNFQWLIPNQTKFITTK